MVLGGTEQTARALVPELAEAGWEVVATCRGERDVPAEIEACARVVELDRADPRAVRDAVAPGADVVIDFVAFEHAHAEQLVGLAGLAGSVVVVSSSSVYADEEGRSLDEATGPDDFPQLAVPITESQRTVEPGDVTYSARKVALERALLEQDHVPTTVVRPGAIHGPGGTWSREWFFVKRAVDGRRYVVLDGAGAGRFHTTSTPNLAHLIRLSAEQPGTRIFNCGDPEPPSVQAIADAVSAALDHPWTTVLRPTSASDDEPGSTPWSVPRPFLLDMQRAQDEVGYQPVVTYSQAVRETCEWLVQATAGRDWHEVLPGSARNIGGLFDYEAEDAYVAGLALP